MKRTVGFAAVLFICSSSACSSQLAHVPDGWVSIAPIYTNAGSFLCTDWAPNGWRVEISADSTRLLIIKQGPWTLRRASIPVPGGQLYGWDGGEFSGGILWRPENAVEDTISHERLVAFVSVAGRTLALVGLAHLSSDRGAILELDSAGGRWSARQLVDLGSVPTAYTALPNDRLLLSTLREVLIVHFGEKPQVLYRVDAYPGLGGTSIIRDRAGVLYLTTRHVVNRLRPTNTGYVNDWLIPRACLPTVESVRSKPDR